ncbi:cytoplasmic polyadenylation element-binding protein 2 isoform X2 [Parasteatoda tepidariorum]|nr:uncharacterized protein LOC107445245 isoform X2 [Parasteatoda tepidariorum]
MSYEKETSSDISDLSDMEDFFHFAENVLGENIQISEGVKVSQENENDPLEKWNPQDCEDVWWSDDPDSDDSDMSNEYEYIIGRYEEELADSSSDTDSEKEFMNQFGHSSDTDLEEEFVNQSDDCR